MTIYQPFFASSVKRSLSLSIFDCEMMRKSDKEKLILIVPRIYKRDLEEDWINWFLTSSSIHQHREAHWKFVKSLKL